MVRQARAPRTQPFGAEAFESTDGTVLRWLGMAGFLINSRGTTLMVDPLLGGFDMPVDRLPNRAGNVPRLDAVLVTHSDNDHYSVPTCRELTRVTMEFHSTRYVGSLMRPEGLPAFGHGDRANAYPLTPLLLYHWGCVDAPDFPPFNGDPASLSGRVENPYRIVVLAPGESFELRPPTS
jgi:glyoxylase-like metal-dependent hydrolase (beta-lactamase superfamily II)